MPEPSNCRSRAARGLVIVSETTSFVKSNGDCRQKPRKPEIEPWKREDILFATRAGISRKQEEIDHHVNVKMAENARAIGAAAERGDLSENSEYKFALEERDLLRARLAQMNSEIGHRPGNRPRRCLYRAHRHWDSSGFPAHGGRRRIRDDLRRTVGGGQRKSDVQLSSPLWRSG